MASLASCVAFYAGRLLRRHDLPSDGFGVGVRDVFGTDRPAPGSDAWPTRATPSTA